MEEPVPPENLAALKKAADAIAPLGIPVATGERLHSIYEFRELFECQAAAALHLAAATPNFKIQEHFNLFAEDWHKRRPNA